jgi:hypothetical protein
MAARTSSEPALLQPRPASRAFLPGLHGVCPKAGSDRTGREPTEDPHAPKDAGSSEAQASTQHMLPERWYAAQSAELGGASPDQLSTLSRATFRRHKACLRPRPHPASTRPGSYADLALQSTTHRGKEQAPSVAGGSPPSALGHKARRRWRPDPVEGVRPHAVPGTRLSTLRAGSKPPTRRASCLPSPTGRSPKGPKTKRRMDRWHLSARPAASLLRAAVEASSHCVALSARPTQPGTRPDLAGTQTLRDRAGALGAERPAMCFGP